MSVLKEEIKKLRLGASIDYVMSLISEIILHRDMTKEQLYEFLEELFNAFLEDN